LAPHRRGRARHRRARPRRLRQRRYRRRQGHRREGHPHVTWTRACATPTKADVAACNAKRVTGGITEYTAEKAYAKGVTPNCNILLVEATSATIANLGTAVNEAVTLGAKYVSNSYGASESSAQTTYDTSYFKHTGVAITVSSGDSGYGAERPAASQYVTAVGGTALTKATSTSRGWTETVWKTSSTKGTGSGCSAYDPKPS